MLNKIPDEVWVNPKATFLEPSCGDGMFVMQIMYKKILNGHNIEDVILSIHARDIMKDNIEICRIKILDLIKCELKSYGLKRQDFIKKMIDLCAIMLYNIRYTNDTLEEDFEKLKPWDESSNPTYIRNAKKYLKKRKYI